MKLFLFVLAFIPSKSCLDTWDVKFSKDLIDPTVIVKPVRPKTTYVGIYKLTPELENTIKKDTLACYDVHMARFDAPLKPYKPATK